MADDGQPEIPVEPEDPEYQLEEHVKFKRKQEILNVTFKKIVAENVTELKPIMDGTSYAYTCLTIKNAGLNELTEHLQNYEHLRKIDVSMNQLKQIQNLLNLKFVTTLNLARNEISSIAFLSRESVFPYLKTVNLLGNKIQIFPSISSKNLRTINLNFNLIKNFQEFDGHPLLQVIEARGNKIESLKGLEKLPKLKQLYVAENVLKDFKYLRTAPCLAKIHARKNQVSIPDFEDIEGVKYLNLRENPVAKVNDLEKIPTSVEILNLLGTPLEAELADNVKKQVWMKFRNYKKINKQEVTGEQREQFAKEYKERIVEQERIAEQERLEKEAAEREAKEGGD